MASRGNHIARGCSESGNKEGALISSHRRLHSVRSIGGLSPSNLQPCQTDMNQDILFGHERHNWIRDHERTRAAHGPPNKHTTQLFRKGSGIPPKIRIGKLTFAGILRRTAPLHPSRRPLKNLNIMLPSNSHACTAAQDNYRMLSHRGWNLGTYGLHRDTIPMSTASSLAHAPTRSMY